MSDPRDARDVLERAEHAATAGNFASADALLRDATRIQEETLGPLHPDLANTFNNLAVVAEKMGNLGDAETFYRRAVAIASASLPPDDPMVVASRENLESFCRANGVSVDAPALVSPTRDDTDVEPETSIVDEPLAAAITPAIERSATAADAVEIPPATDVTPPSIPRPSLPVAPQPAPGAAVAARGSRVIVWVAIAVVVLLAVLLVWRPWSSRNASAPAASDVVPRQEPPPPAPAAIEPAAPPTTAPLRGDEGVPDKNPAAPTRESVTLVAAELCRSFSTSGRNWRCDRVDDAVAPGPLVLYTRVRSAHPDTVVHRWYQGGTLRQSVRLAIGANTRDGYRTYSRQTVRAGDWRVEVRSADDTLLNEQRFSVR